MKNYKWYKLDGKIPAIDETNGQWFKQNRSRARIAHALLNNETEITTVFLCLSTDDSKRPLLFETSVFIKNVAEKICKYATYDEAILGHKKLVEENKKNLNIP
jgi:hypothetical protein